MTGHTPTASPAPISHRSALAALRSSPRFAWLMVALLFSAISVGAREVTRLRYVSDAFGSEFGIGTVAVVFALTLAVSSVVAGRLVDTHDPRPYLVGSLVAGFVVTIINAWLLTRGQMPMGWLIPSVAIEAVTFGVGTTGLVKIQAALVPVAARGTAEPVNILRTGLGAAVGTVIAGVVGGPVAASRGWPMGPAQRRSR